MLQLRSLRHLAVLAQRLNYARAAEDLGMSQSALSRSIQALEAQLGFKLFDRDRGGVSLTPQGRQVVERASSLLADAEDLERQSILTAKGAAGRVRLGMTPMIARALLSSVLTERLTVAPDVTNDVMVRDVDALWSLLVAGEIEFFMAPDGPIPDAAPARVDTLGNFPLSLIVRAGHPLLESDCPGATFPVVRASWAGLPVPSEIQDRIRGTPNVIEDFGSLAAITAATDAIWFSSTYSVVEELRAGTLRELPHPPHVPPRAVRMMMYSLARRSPSPLARSFKETFRHHLKALASARAEPVDPNDAVHA